MEDNVLIRTIFEYCKIKKITLDEFVEQVKDYEGEKMNKKASFDSVLLWSIVIVALVLLFGFLWQSFGRSFGG